LCFGTYPQKKMPCAALSFVWYKGIDITDEINDKKELIGTLPELVERTTTLLKQYLPVSSHIHENHRIDNHLVSAKALRELIANAVCHRDYSIYTRKIKVSLFSDRLEIQSPGKLPNSLTIEKLRYGHSAPRNMLLLKIFDHMRLTDGLGRGFPLLYREFKDRLHVQDEGEIFTVTVYFATDLV
jgi:ATP-dependent DNA helicase RecG